MIQEKETNKTNDALFICSYLMTSKKKCHRFQHNFGFHSHCYENVGLCVNVILYFLDKYSIDFETYLVYVQTRELKLSTKPVESVPLEQRRLLADLCKVYKHLGGLNRNNPDIFLRQCSSNLRDHSLKLRKTYSRTEIRKQIFTQFVSSITGTNFLGKSCQLLL